MEAFARSRRRHQYHDVIRGNGSETETFKGTVANDTGDAVIYSAGSGSPVPAMTRRAAASPVGGRLRLADDDQRVGQLLAGVPLPCPLVEIDCGAS